MTDITIPPEVVEAAARTLADLQYWSLSKAGLGTLPRDEFVEKEWKLWVPRARAAIRAALAAWPGMSNSQTMTYHGNNAWGVQPSIILPLTKEARDDQ